MSRGIFTFPSIQISHQVREGISMRTFTTEEQSQSSFFFGLIKHKKKIENKKTG